MLCATCAFAIGILWGRVLWNPASWWIGTDIALISVAFLFLVRHRLYLALALALVALIFLGVLDAQLEGIGALAIANDNRFALLTDGREAQIAGHVVREGMPRHDAAGRTRQTVDIETEQIGAGNEDYEMHFGLRLNIYSGATSEDSEATDSPAHVAGQQLNYGQRLRFTCKLRQPRNFLNPGAFDYRQFLSAQNIVALGSVRDDRLEILSGFSGSRFGRWRSQLRQSLLRHIQTLWPQRDAALISAMLIGDRGGVDQATTLDYQRTGAYHILVVAGLKVGIFAFTLLWIFRRLRLPDGLATLLTIAFITAYALISESGAPVVRATAMLAIYLATRWLYRERSAMNAIGVAALGMLLWDPRSLFDASFQLTFLSMLAIAGIALPLLERSSIPRQRALRNFDSLDYDLSLPPRLAQFRLDLRMIALRLARFIGPTLSKVLLLLGWRGALAVFDVIVLSAVLQIALALPMAFYFHRAIALGIPANSVVVPLHSLLLPVAASAVAVSYLSLAPAQMMAGAAALLLHATNHVVETLAHWQVWDFSVGDMRVPTPRLIISLLTASAFVFALWAVRRNWRLAAISLAALAALACTLLLPVHPAIHAGTLEITAIDVGQGDSILLVSPQGRTLLVDAGGELGASDDSRFDMGEDVVSPYLWSRGIGHLDAVALTHAHADHIGGMRSVISNFHPRELWVGPLPVSHAVLTMLEAAEQQNVAVVRRAAGEELAFGGVAVHFLAPARTANVVNGKASNDDSLVMKVSYGTTSALLEGDAEKKIERQLVPQDVAADLLKVAHHGSATSSMPELLDAIHPRYAVISVGFRSPFQHPRPEVLERLQHAKILTYRTDTLGATSFFLDGKKVTAQTAADR